MKTREQKKKQQSSTRFDVKIYQQKKKETEKSVHQLKKKRT